MNDFLLAIASGIIGAVLLWIFAIAARRIFELSGHLTADLIIHRDSSKQGGVPGQQIGPLSYGRITVAVHRGTNDSGERLFAKAIAPGDRHIIVLKPGNYYVRAVWERRLAPHVDAILSGRFSSGRHELLVGIVSSPTDEDSIYIVTMDSAGNRPASDQYPPGYVADIAVPAG